MSPKDPAKNPDVQEEGLLTRAEAVCKVEPRHLEQLLHPQFKDPEAMAAHVLAHGLAASPGAAVGRVVFTASMAEEWNARGEPVILVRTETSPEDVGGATLTVLHFPVVHACSVFQCMRGQQVLWSFVHAASTCSIETCSDTAALDVLCRVMRLYISGCAVPSAFSGLLQTRTANFHALQACMLHRES